ncbi:DUF3604 domain-containing protein [Spongiibacter pelagi]|uniref:DUF3604 domain-containing protein n=1 Tax=Spongiibacter pelagi TaxID=2760804 RepID=UPI00295AA6E6|nr:DUF3604 domain-containing protein [Spongiibacter pelagi]
MNLLIARVAILLLLSASAQLVLATESKNTSNQESNDRCQNYQANKQVLFGDLHVHTRYSLDASTQNTRTTPQQAYAFAKGAEIGIQPWRADGTALRHLQLNRPLDFAAVTDHAELLGEVHICQSPAEIGYTSWQCRFYRSWPRGAFFLFNTTAAMTKRLGFCGEEGQYCREASAGPWLDIQQAAAQANDTESCEFTSFVAYEWTGASENLGNLHRNIIFANEQVPRLPTSFIDAPSAEQLWQRLDEQCTDADGDCDVLVIPHNSNLSDGFMFLSTREDGSPLDRDTAQQRARLERLVEVMQHKGSSECYYGPLNSEDELCSFEQLSYARFKDKFLGKILPALSEAAKPEAGYVRDVLGQGLQIESDLGVNPFALGMIASTDTHLGAPGAVSESNFPGHGGAGAPAEEGEQQGLPDDLEYNPGGLAAVWAEENSREAIFNSLRNREVYATSGSRMTLRFFAGADLPEDICSSSDYAQSGYQYGVPMGSELVLGDADIAGPVFSVAAAVDPESGAQSLQRIQIIKGSVDAQGQRSEQVIDIAQEPLREINPDQCVLSGGGRQQLCVRWQDPSFDPQSNNYYYARVLEQPSCRWSQQLCIKAGVDCADPENVAPEFAACCSAEHRKTIQERAWSSPIWVAPANSEY